MTTDGFEFEGSLNELQQALTETIRQRIQAENRLCKMGDDNEWRGIQINFVEWCKSWEEKLTDDLIKRTPKGQQVLF